MADSDNTDEILPEQLTTANSTEWDELKAGLDESFDELQETFSNWKAGYIDKFLLNEDVYIYDFENDPKKLTCYSTGGGKPCCLSECDEDSGNPQYKAIYDAWVNGEWGTTAEKIDCRRPFGMEYNGQNACWLTDLKIVTCEEKYTDACIYDKNGVPCCTKKLDMANSWLDAGWIEEDEGPYQIWKDQLDQHNLWDKYLEEKWTVDIGSVYHVAATHIKTRWNFECPTHHPVPTVAIILGCFIPITIILFAIIGIQWYRGQNGQQNGTKRKKIPEEQAAIDEIPPAENA